MWRRCSQRLKLKKHQKRFETSKKYLRNWYHSCKLKKIKTVRKTKAVLFKKKGLIDIHCQYRLGVLCSHWKALVEEDAFEAATAALPRRGPDSQGNSVRFRVPNIFHILPMNAYDSLIKKCP